MKTVFADCGYWIAISDSRDQWHERAKTVTAQLSPVRTVTSQMVLVEFLNFMSGQGQHLRSLAAEAVSSFAGDPRVEVVHQTDPQFRTALDLYSSRSDKGWSLTDCASFAIMQELDILEALAYDHDFEQAGFIALLRGGPY